METKPYERESCNVLQECIELQIRKSNDYQNPKSNVVQSDHYRRGIDTIHDMISQKLLRAQSLLESEGDPAFESLEDTYKDLINYASFAVSYMRGGMQGQDGTRDMFNKKYPVSTAPKQSDADPGHDNSYTDADGNVVRPQSQYTDHSPINWSR